MAEIIATEKLRSQETRKFIENTFRDGAIKTTGMDIDKLMPPVSRFGGGNRTKKKQDIIEKFKAFFKGTLGLALRSFEYQVYQLQQTGSNLDDCCPFGLL